MKSEWEPRKNCREGSRSNWIMKRATQDTPVMPEHPNATFFFALFDSFCKIYICTGSIRDPTAGKPGCLNVVLRFSSFARNFTDNHRHDLLDFVLAGRCTQMFWQCHSPNLARSGKIVARCTVSHFCLAARGLHQQPLSWAGLFCIQTASCPHVLSDE